MKNIFYDILKGTFLTSDGAYKKWRLIIFFSVLALIMIASSHSADRKVYHIALLQDQVKAYRSQYVETRAELMGLKMESKIVNKMKEKGLKPSEKPPVKILISSELPN